MSRVGKSPINLPAGVEISIADGVVTVKGKKATLKHNVPFPLIIKKEDNVLLVEFDKKDDQIKKIAGTTRALLNSMVEGVSKGFERKLTLLGVGYRANVQGKKLNLTLGFSHPLDFPIPEGIIIETPTQTEIIIKGADKVLVGQVAAKIRLFREPEPYKGKGERYADERIVLKETKKK